MNGEPEHIRLSTKTGRVVEIEFLSMDYDSVNQSCLYDDAFIYLWMLTFECVSLLSNAIYVYIYIHLPMRKHQISEDMKALYFKLTFIPPNVYLLLFLLIFMSWFIKYWWLGFLYFSILSNVLVIVKQEGGYRCYLVSILLIRSRDSPECCIMGLSLHET